MNNNRGCTLLGAIMGALILSIVMLAFFSMLALMGKYTGKLNKLFNRMDTAPLVTICAGTAECEGTPALCLTSHGNDSTLACTPSRQCVFNGALWVRDNVDCDQGMLFKRRL